MTHPVRRHLCIAAFAALLVGTAFGPAGALEPGSRAPQFLVNDLEGARVALAE